MITQPEVRFGLYALAIKPGITPTSVSDLQPFSDLDDLRTDQVSSYPYATFEPDFWLLDGGYKLMPTDSSLVHVGMMSLDQSDGNGDFSVRPELLIEFSEAVTVDGLVLHFSRYSGDYITEVDIRWYDYRGWIFYKNAYYPDGTDYEIDQPFENVGAIRIYFNSTSRPYRYLRLSGIDFGKLITFDASNIKSANVIEDADPISLELRANRLDLRLFSEDSTFNPFDPTGYYTVLKERQPLDVYEIVNNAPIFMGQYFLDAWKTVGDTEIELGCIDWITILERLPSRGGLYESPGTTVDDLLDDLLTPESVSFEIHPSLSGTRVIGWLPTGSLRESLHQIAFAIGAIVDCSRTRAVNLIPSPIALVDSSTATILNDQMGIDRPLTLLPLVTEIQITAHSYVESTDSVDLFNGVLTVGEHEILFEEPAHDLNVSGATITESGANYAVVSVAVQGTVTLTGQSYLDNLTIYQAAGSGSGSVTNPGLSITDATLVHKDNVGIIGSRVYNYFQQRYKQQVRLYSTALVVGQVVTVDSLYDRQVRGVIERMAINLSGGMITDLTIIGVEAD